MYGTSPRLHLNLPSIVYREMCKTLIYIAFLLQQHCFPKMESVLAIGRKDFIY